MTHIHAYRTHKINIKAQLVHKLVWKQADGRTDTTDFITFRANAIGNKRCTCFRLKQSSKY